MGVRGLTTYIERNKHKYLKKHNLRDCQLVIDGNSLCAQLYKYNSKCNDVFGGDYDKFAKCIETFFSMLKQCNVTPVVIFDGGYEVKKIRTVNGRLQNKLKLIRNMNPVCADSATIFPLFLREAFKDTLVRLNIPFVRCDYEADLEIACVARQLGCPVLSYDSDFYIFDCLYIPFTSMDFHVTRITDGQGSKYCICCNLYDIEIFLKQHRIQKPLLPIMATLLGNDYVKKSVFAKFYNHLKLPKKNGTRTPQYRTIVALINWLQNETYDTAVKKVLGRVKRQQRYKLGKILLKISQGYFASNSETLEYLGLAVKNENNTMIPEINAEEIESDDSEDEDITENISDMDSSDTNSVKSENDESSEEDLSEINENKSDQILNLKWFKKNVRNGNFPTLFIDILTLNLGIYSPQIEDTKNIQSFYIFLPILQGICKILLKDNRKYFYYLARNEHSHVKKYSFKVMGMELPDISKLEAIDKQKSRIYLMKILSLPDRYLTEILKFPAEWQLYLLSLIYWVKNAQIPKVSYNHVSCIILCLLHLNMVDKKENIRKKDIFKKKFDDKLKTISNKRKETKSNENKTDNNKDNDLTTLTQIVSHDDILFYIDSFVSNFDMDEKLRTNKNLFSIHIIDAFSQFQSCLLHIKYLNALLNFPLDTFDICLFFNGTFIYNLYINFEKRTNIFSYIELLLKNSPSILRIYNEIFNILNPILSLSANAAVNKKSRKRKRKHKVSVETPDSDNGEEENTTEMDVDNYIDENNIFSILSIVE